VMVVVEESSAFLLFFFFLFYGFRMVRFLWALGSCWNNPTGRPPHVTRGSRSSNRVSALLSAAAEKTRERARWLGGQQRPVASSAVSTTHTHAHVASHSRESVCGEVHRRAGEKKHQQSLTRSPSRRSTLIRVSLLCSYYIITRIIFSTTPGNNFINRLCCCWWCCVKVGAFSQSEKR
jgi:hypothetical protein